MNLGDRSRTWAILLAAALIIAGCSRDPNVLKKKHFDRGEAYFQQGKYQEAAIEFQNAIQFDSKYSQAHYELAQTYLKQGDWSARIPGTAAHRSARTGEFQSTTGFGKFAPCGGQTSGSARPRRNCA